MTERSSVNSPLGQDDREAPSHGTCFCYSGSTWLQTASKQLDASQTSGKEKSIDSRFLATSSYRTLQTPSLSFKTCSGHSMDPVKDKVSNFKDSDGNQGVKGITNEAKEGMADYKKDGGNKMQFGKDEAQNLKGSSVEPNK